MSWQRYRNTFIKADSVGNIRKILDKVNLSNSQQKRIDEIMAMKGNKSRVNEFNKFVNRSNAFNRIKGGFIGFNERFDLRNNKKKFIDPNEILGTNKKYLEEVLWDFGLYEMDFYSLSWKDSPMQLFMRALSYAGIDVGELNNEALISLLEKFDLI